MDTPPPGPSSPSDVERAAEFLQQGDPPAVVHEKLIARGFSADAAQSIIREAMFGPEPAEDEGSRRSRRLALLVGGILFGFGLIVFVLGLITSNEASIYYGIRSTVIGGGCLAFNAIR